MLAALVPDSKRACCGVSRAAWATFAWPPPMASPAINIPLTTTDTRACLYAFSRPSPLNVAVYEAPPTASPRTVS